MVPVAREWADEAAWLLAAVGTLLHSHMATTRLLAVAPALHAAVTPPSGLAPCPGRPWPTCHRWSPPARSSHSYVGPDPGS
ncbi:MULTISPECIES: hypothetical protein [unclassified Streptomyces]|uniref:hypothetical protein n=1 Tax=unclassified Streptomyces TaxID=2593676 RepID=UPI0009CAD35B|nr:MULTISPECIES: hypothetical protein [unclassified Streptomyces]ONI50053.1 hypothetical protein STIB_57670 [Streptomyces sp. IB2014 011-1]